MKLEFIAHATFSVHLDDGRHIIIDPYQGMSFQGRFNYPSYSAMADFVLITHEHLDHSYFEDIKGNPVIVRQSWNDDGLKVSSVFAYHDKYKGTKFGGYVLMKIMEADGLRICHMGDCGEILSDEQIGRMGRLDVLLVPVGGFYTINGDEAFELVRRIDARVVIPCHYLTPRCSLKLEDENRFLSHFDSISRMSGIVDVKTFPEGIVHLKSRY